MYRCHGHWWRVKWQRAVGEHCLKIIKTVEGEILDSILGHVSEKSTATPLRTERAHHPYVTTVTRVFWRGTLLLTMVNCCHVRPLQLLDCGVVRNLLSLCRLYTAMKLICACLPTKVSPRTDHHLSASCQSKTDIHSSPSLEVLAET